MTFHVSDFHRGDIPFYDNQKIEELRASNGTLSRIFKACTLSNASDLATKLAMSIGVKEAITFGIGATVASSLPMAVAGGMAAGVVIGSYEFLREYRKAQNIYNEGGLPPRDFTFKHFAYEVSKSALKTGIGGAAGFGFASVFGEKIVQFLAERAPGAVSFVHALDLPGKVSGLFNSAASTLKDWWGVGNAIASQNLNLSPAESLAPYKPATNILRVLPADAPQGFISGAAPILSDEIKLAAIAQEAPLPPQPQTAPKMPRIAATDFAAQSPSPLTLTPDAPGAVALSDLPLSAQPSLQDKIRELAEAGKATPKGKAIIEAALSGKAQGLEDLSYAAANGKFGIAKNLTDAVEYSRQAIAAEPGSAAAKKAAVNLAYWKFHGLGGFVANTKEAILELKSLGPNTQAREMLGEWLGTKTQGLRTVAAAATQQVRESVAAAPGKLGCVFKTAQDGSAYSTVCKVSKEVLNSARIGAPFSAVLSR